MWIFTRSSFLSIVADQDWPDTLVVRARVRGDIHRLWPKAVVDITPNRDYKYRAQLPHAEVADALSREVVSINYGNYKAEAGRKDARRVPFYAWIWSVMADAGDALERHRVQ